MMEFEILTKMILGTAWASIFDRGNNSATHTVIVLSSAVVSDLDLAVAECIAAPVRREGNDEFAVSVFLATAAECAILGVEGGRPSVTTIVSQHLS